MSEEETCESCGRKGLFSDGIYECASCVRYEAAIFAAVDRGRAAELERCRLALCPHCALGKPLIADRPFLHEPYGPYSFIRCGAAVILGHELPQDGDKLMEHRHSPSAAEARGAARERGKWISLFAAQDEAVQNLVAFIKRYAMPRTAKEAEAINEAIDAATSRAAAVRSEVLRRGEHRQ